jgi:essential nuclear protein 1
LNAEDERMLDMFGSLDLKPVDKKKSKVLTPQEKEQAAELLRMAGELDARIESKNVQIKNDEIKADFTKDPKVQQVYGDIAALFAKYRSGKVPQAFRILALADQWENLMDLTKPENWTPHAMWAVTKTFTTEMTVDR